MRIAVARGIVYAAALLGLFAMHGLTVDHSGHPADQHVGQHAMTHTDILTGAPHDDGSEHLGTACVAVLAGVLLLLVGLAALRRPTTAARGANLRRTAATRSRSPPKTWSLSQLCVLRI